MFLWRISNHTSLGGDGGLRASARWHTRGRRIVYCAEHPAAALLEILVRFELEIGDLPTRYRLLKIESPENVPLERSSLEDLPHDWLQNTEVTRAVGDAWLAKASSALLVVPSAIVPETVNILVNPAHPDAERVVIARVTEHVIDPRLLA